MRNRCHSREAVRNDGETKSGYTGFRGSFLSSRIQSAWCYGKIFMETRTRVPTYASVLCLAAWLTLNFVAPSLWRTHLVCQPLQVAPSNKWSWVRADNTGHVDLVNLNRGIFQNPCDTDRAARTRLFDDILKVRQIVDTRFPHMNIKLLYYSRQLKNNFF